MTESIQVLIAQNLGVDESRVTEGTWSYVKKTDTDFRESADTANSTKDFLRFLP